MWLLNEEHTLNKAIDIQTSFPRILILGYHAAVRNTSLYSFDPFRPGDGENYY